MRKEVSQNVPADKVATVVKDAVLDGGEKIECFKAPNGQWVVVAWFN